MNPGKRKRVYIACFGSGLGHATRMLEVARLLKKEGTSVLFSSSGEVVSFIRRSGYECRTVPLVDVSYTQNGTFSPSNTLALSPILAARALAQFKLEQQGIAAFRPDVVLSDSVLSSVLAAKLSERKTVTVLNQVRLHSSTGESSIISRVVSTVTGDALGRVWGVSDTLLFPDLPPPYTISERNLWGARVGPNSRYIGFLLPECSEPKDAVVEAFEKEDRPRIFFQVSGPPRTRPPLLRAALSLASILSDRYSFVISGGDPTGSSTPVKVRGGWYYSWCRVACHLLRVADVVVSRSGHGTVAQIIANSKPSLLIPIPGQTEQDGNASKAAKLGISIRLDQDSLSPLSFASAVSELLSGDYRKNAEKVGIVARSYNAQREVLSAIKSLFS